MQKYVTAAQKLVDAGAMTERADCGEALTGMLDEALALSDELMSFQEVRDWLYISATVPFIIYLTEIAREERGRHPARAQAPTD